MAAETLSHTILISLQGALGLLVVMHSIEQDLALGVACSKEASVGTEGHRVDQVEG